METSRRERHVPVENLLDLLARIVGLILETPNPLTHAKEIVRQTAITQNADVSTLFVVEDRSRLALEAGVAFLGDTELDLPPAHSYQLNWNATHERDVRGQGLTAFVATSGRSLSIRSVEDLLNEERHAAHAGRWDHYIYPPHGDIRDPETGFGCLYAVPLKRSNVGPPKDAVIGVFKIERRANRPKFADDDHRVFELVAAHLSLILQTYYRAQYRVFSDVAHAIGGGLDRGYLVLSSCIAALESSASPADTLAFLKAQLPDAYEIIDRACGRLNVVLEISKDPDRVTEVTIETIWKHVIKEVELKANRILDEQQVRLNVDSPLGASSQLKLRSMAYHDLTSILGNLLDNAIRHGGGVDPAIVRVRHKVGAFGGHLTFIISDNGPGVPQEVLREVQGTTYNQIYRLPETSAVVRGTGLRRAFGLASLNDWRITCDVKGGSCFEIETPDFSAVQP